MDKKTSRGPDRSAAWRAVVEGDLDRAPRPADPRFEEGRAHRAVVPRTAHAHYERVDRDPVALVEAQNVSRLPELLGLRRERMSASPFAFYRGTAALMAHDLAAQVVTGRQVVCCGDAHLANFGLYASPERRLVADLNDFDEAAPGPWEWDVKRLVTSVVVAGRGKGLAEGEVRAVAGATVAAYRTTLRRAMRLGALDRYYLGIDAIEVEERLGKATPKAFVRAARKALARTAEQAIDRMMTTTSDGRVVFVEAPPVLTHAEEELDQVVRDLWQQYRRTVRPDVALLLADFEPADVALRVVGVGSVGTRCFVVALTAPDGSRLLLQIKEALRSAVATYAGGPGSVADVAGVGRAGMGAPPRVVAPDAPEGQRVVAHQQVLQAVSDPFLGFLSARGRDYYVRQFRDMKGSIDVGDLHGPDFGFYAAGCARLLARGHVQTPGAAWIAGYLGGSDTFDSAVVEWCHAYADQVEEDYRVFAG